ncbi:MAG: sulfotransferase family 2 domain-containing protein [Bacteroidota bacterium]
MATLLKPGPVFLHVPKTGGTFLRMFFKESGLIRFDFARDHADMERVLNVSSFYRGNFLKRSIQLGKNLDHYVAGQYKFCFVRDPFSWYESAWKFLMDNKAQTFSQNKTRSRFGFKIDTWQPWNDIEKCRDEDFNRFIECMLKHYPGYLTGLYNRYSDERHINYVGKQEELEHDTRKIFSETGIPFNKELFRKTGQVNKSKTPAPKWNDNNRNRIYREEKAVFMKYGY